jgi:dihydrodipicolinate synthase/N-acetylneuraminate lyase
MSNTSARAENKALSHVVRIAPRRSSAIFVCTDSDGVGWLALAGAHGWLFGSRTEAIAEAQWLSENFGLPVREIAP